MQRRLFSLSALAAVSATAAGLGRPAAPRAQGASFPALVTLVVPFAPGGGADQLAREFANAAAPLVPGTTFVVDNKPGANGIIANRYVARQKPDGATFLLGTSSTHALGPLIHRGDVDPVADFSPETLQEAITAARQKPVTYGTFGAGSSAHLYGLVLASATGAKLEHVPYKGSAQAITDLLAGHVESVFLTTSALDAMARQGRIRLLAVSGEKRSQLLPDVPTFNEQGVPQLEFNGWFGLFGPKGTPAPLLDRLAAVARMLGDDQPLRNRLVDQGYDWVGSTPDALARELARTMEIYTRIVATTPAGELSR